MASVGDVDTIGEGTLERNAAGSRHSLCNDATRAVPYMYDVHVRRTCRMAILRPAGQSPEQQDRRSAFSANLGGDARNHRMFTSASGIADGAATPQRPINTALYTEKHGRRA